MFHGFILLGVIGDPRGAGVRFFDFVSIFHLFFTKVRCLNHFLFRSFLLSLSNYQEKKSEPPDDFAKYVMKKILKK
jgi:hypothetical protein